jgi:hypothetical protein
MIVFDENIHQESLMKDVARWYRGKVLSIRDLRPGTFIKDEDIPHLLQRRKKKLLLSPSMLQTFGSLGWPTPTTL